MAASVTDKDNGYARMIEELDKLKDLWITVGVHAEEGAGDEGNGRTVAEVAEANEFGLGVPARPAITGWADENAETFPARMRDEAAAALKAKVSPAQRLDALAQVAAGEIQAKIAGGVPPPNAPSTIAKKSSSTPLVDKGQFRSSIRGKVTAGDSK